MTAKAEFDITANDQGAKAAWDRQQNAINAVIARIGKMEEAQNKAKTSQDTFFSKSVAGFAGMVTGALSFQGAMSGVIQANQQMIDQADRAAIKYDELFRKINVQAGVRGLESAGMQKSITDVAIRNASTIEESASTAQQLAGAGFSTADASGGALDAMLKLFGGTGQTGTGNAGQLTQSMTQFISAMGMDRNAENLQRIAVAVQQSYKAGDLQLEDLTQIAAKSAGLKGKLSPEETLGAFATIRETMGGEQASTGLKIFGERVTGAREDPMRMEMLKRMNIKADDIDLVGENINQVLETMAKGVESLPEKERAAVMQKFFGGEGASAASYLIDNRNRIGFYADRMANRAGFESDAAEAASGPAAQRRRLALRAETEAARKFQNEKNMLDAADLAASEAGLSPAMRALSRFEANTAMMFGVSPESAVGFGYSGRFGVRPDGSVGTFGGGLAEDTNRILGETAAAGPAMGGADAGPERKRAPSGPRNLAEAMNAGAFSGGHDAAGRDAVEAMRGGGLDKLAEKLDQIARNTARPPVVIEKPAVAKKPASAAAGTGGR